MESGSVYGLLSEALGRHITITSGFSVDGLDLGKRHLHFVSDVDVQAKPPFESDNQTGHEWDGTLGTKGFLMPLYGWGVGAHNVQQWEVHEAIEGKPRPYIVLKDSVEVTTDVDQDGITHHIASLSRPLFFMEGASDATCVSFYDILALLAAQDSSDEDTKKMLQNAIINDPLTCGLDHDERRKLLDRLLALPRYIESGDGKDLSIDAIRPEVRIVANSKVAQVLGNSDLYDEESTPLTVGNQLQISFRLENTGDVTTPIDREDVAVLDAIQTLKNAGNTVITPWQIVKNMGYAPTERLASEIHGRVLRLMQTLGTLDWSKQAKVYGVIDESTGLPVEHAEIISNLAQLTVAITKDSEGNESIRYRIDGDTMTYQHANEVNQVIRYPPELLEVKPIDVDGKVRARSTRDQKKIQRAVLWYVFALKGSNNLSNDIRYEALWSHDGYAPRNNDARKRAITHTHDCLRALKERGIIKGFSPIYEGRAHKQVKVLIDVGKQRKRLK